MFESSHLAFDTYKRYFTYYIFRFKTYPVHEYSQAHTAEAFLHRRCYFIVLAWFLEYKPKALFPGILSLSSWVFLKFVFTIRRLLRFTIGHHQECFNIFTITFVLFLDRILHLKARYFLVTLGAWLQSSLLSSSAYTIFLHSFQWIHRLNS